MSKDHQELDIELEQFMQANGWEYKPNKGGTFYWQQFNGIYKSQMGISEARQLLIHCKSLITLEVEKAVNAIIGEDEQEEYGDLVANLNNNKLDHMIRNQLRAEQRQKLKELTERKQL